MYSRTITAKDFIEHTAPAVKALFQAMCAEEARYKPLKESIGREQNRHYSDFSTADINDDFDELQVQNKFVQSAEAKMQMTLITYSIEVLCGAVFQIAKQGISLVLKESDRYSKGRSIGSQKLSNIIWHGRNQAMHWEEGIPTKGLTKACFDTLKADFGKQFEFDGSPKNMAWNLWAVIGWDSYEKYESDMKVILK